LDGQSQNVRWKCSRSSFYNTAAVARRTVKNGCHAVARRWQRRLARKVVSIPTGRLSIHDSHPGYYRLPVAEN